MEISEHFFTTQADAEFQALYNRFGDPFYELIDRTIEQIRTHPESAPVFEEGIRRIVLRNTPFGLFYGIHGTRIAIVAILDLRQNPDAINRRLDL